MTDMLIKRLNKAWMGNSLCKWLYLAFLQSRELKNFFFLIFIFEREKERQSVSEGGADREGDTESEAASGLWAVSTEPDAGLKLL